MLCCPYSIQKMCRSSSGVDKSVDLHCYSQALLYSLSLKHFIIQFQLISEISVCIFVLNNGCTGMQAIMDIICVWVLVVAALMVFCFLRCCQQGDFVVQNKCMLYFLPNTSLHSKARTGTLSKVYVKNKVPPMIFDII